MSDTNQPIHDIDHGDEPTELIVTPPPGVIVNVNGDWVYQTDGELYDGYELSPSEREPEFEWGNPSGRSRDGYSQYTFGHTFLRHGRHKTAAQLQDRAKSLPAQQSGHFLDETAAAAFLAEHYDPTKTAPYEVAIPPDLAARVIYADGTIATPTHVRIVPHSEATRALETAYPIVKE